MTKSRGSEINQAFCPVCGQPWDGRRRRQPGVARTALAMLLESQDWKRTPHQMLASGSVVANVASAAGATWKRREPARAANVPGDVIVPFAQSIITGMVGVTGGALLAGWNVGAVTGALAFAGTWIALLFDHRRLLWLTETVTGRDLDGDHSVGKPDDKPDPPIILRAPERFKSPRQEWADVEPGDLRDVSSPNRRLALDLIEFLRLGVRDGFGIRDWTGRTLSSGTTVSDGKWREWTALLKTASILQADNAGTRLADGLTLDEALKCILAERRNR